MIKKISNALFLILDWPISDASCEQYYTYYSILKANYKGFLYEWNFELIGIFKYGIGYFHHARCKALHAFICIIMLKALEVFGFGN